MRSVTFVRLVVACLVPAAVACGRFSNLERCQDLAKRVNPTLDDIERGTKRRTPATYASASVAYQKLAKDLQAFAADAGPEGGIPRPLDAFERSVEDYRLVLEAASRHTSGLAGALDAGNTESATLEARQLEETTRQAKSAAKRVDAACRPDF